MELEAFWSSDVWVFRHNGERQWEWRLVSVDGEQIKQSVAGFFRLDECVEDATRHGYVANGTSVSAPDDARRSLNLSRGVSKLSADR